jgi:VWFA-related protein
LVQVDAVVLDASGHPVHGLTRADFTVLDRGTPQPIELFREVSHDRPPRAQFPETLGLDVADNATASTDRLVVIVIDDLHFQGKTDEVKEVARRVIRELGQSASVALLTTSRTIGVEFTEDRSVLLRAIDRFKDKFDPEGRPMHPGYRTAYGSGPGPGDPAQFFANLQTWRTMREAAAMIGAETRLRKAFIWISAGLGAGSSTKAVLASEPRMSQGLFDSGEAYGTEVGAMMDAMRRGNVATYALDPGGYGANGASLAMVANNSGGFVIHRDEIESGLTRLLQDLDSYYLLGFYPADPDPKDRRYRRLEIRVNRPGLTVRARQGYVTMPPVPLPRNDSYLVDLSVSVMPATNLPMRLQAVPFPTTGRDARVLLTIEVPATRAALGPAGRGGEIVDRVDYAVLAADLNKKKVTRNFENRATVTVPPASPSDSAGAVTYQIVTDLKLPPGPYQLRASATSRALGRGGSVYLTFDAPDFTKTPLGLGGFVLGCSGKRAVSFLTNVEERNLVPFTPVLDREFDRDTTLEVLVPVYRKSARTDIALALEVIDRADAVLAKHAQRIGWGSRPELRLPLSLSGFASGPYRLRVTADDGTTSATRELGIVIR